jgi:hypothetical protein
MPRIVIGIIANYYHKPVDLVNTKMYTASLVLHTFYFFWSEMMKVDYHEFSN